MGADAISSLEFFEPAPLVAALALSAGFDKGEPPGPAGALEEGNEAIVSAGPPGPDPAEVAEVTSAPSVGPDPTEVTSAPAVGAEVPETEGRGGVGARNPPPETATGEETDASPPPETATGEEADASPPPETATGEEADASPPAETATGEETDASPPAETPTLPGAPEEAATDSSGPETVGVAARGRGDAGAGVVVVKSRKENPRFCASRSSDCSKYPCFGQPYWPPRPGVLDHYLQDYRKLPRATAYVRCVERL